MIRKNVKPAGLVCLFVALGIAGPVHATEPCFVGGDVELGLDVQVGRNPTMGEGVRIDSYVRIGDDVVIGNNVRIMPSAWIGHNVTLDDGAVVAPHARIADRARVGREVSVGTHAALGEGSVLGEGSTIGTWSSIGRHVTVGEQVVLFDSTTLGDDCVVDDGAYVGSARIGSECRLGPGSYVGHGTTIGAGFELGPDAMVWDHTQVGHGVTVRSSARISSRVTLGDRVSINEGTVLGSWVTVGDNVELGPASVVHNDTNLGPRTRLGAGVEIWPDAQIGSHVVLGAGCSVGSVVVGDDNRFGPRCEIWSGTQIGVGNRFGDDVVVGEDCEILEDNTVGHNVRIGSESSLDCRVTVEEGVDVPDQSTLVGTCYEDAFRAELEAATGFDHVLARWRENDGRTVSAQWSFPTDQRTDIAPDIEAPRGGDYPWYDGSWANVLDDAAIWTPRGWFAPVLNRGTAILTARNRNLKVPGTKKGYYAYFWTTPTGAVPPGPTSRLVPATCVITKIDSWPSLTMPGFEYVIVDFTCNGCPDIEVTLSQPPGGAPVGIGRLVIVDECELEEEVHHQRNECELDLDDCDGSAVCVDRYDGYTCECAPGYTSDGTSCTDIDECSEGVDACDAVATCENHPGGYTCRCPDGWIGDGKYCSPDSSPSCWLPTGEVMIPGANIVGVDPTTCGEMGGAVIVPIPPKPENPDNGGEPLPAGEDLPEELEKDVEETGIDKRKYVPRTHDCDDFADALEKALEEMGYCATFTLMWRKDANTGRWVEGHAITDVHLPDGTTVWIEPQTGRRVDLDRDNDGRVNVKDRRTGRGQTEEDLRIEVYENREEAEDVFGPLD